MTLYRYMVEVEEAKQPASNRPRVWGRFHALPARSREEAEAIIRAVLREPEHWTVTAYQVGTLPFAETVRILNPEVPQ